jgi:hypothetical protein
LFDKTEGKDSALAVEQLDCNGLEMAALGSG